MTDWALAKATEFLFGDNIPSGAEAHVARLAALLDEVREETAQEIRQTWSAARSAKGQMEAFQILERMVDRIGYGRLENNPSLVK
jgi:uncharacterized iron-regulated protein